MQAPHAEAPAAAVSEQMPTKRRGRKKKAEEPAAAQPAAAEQDAVPDVDLAANVPTGEHWQRVQRWVVFSDLHVSLKTTEVACAVLRRVQQEAAARDAGVLFLGAHFAQRQQSSTLGAAAEGCSQSTALRLHACRATHECLPGQIVCTVAQVTSGTCAAPCRWDP